MKILIVAPSRKMGGIERALSVLANEWAEQGFEVVYVSCLKSEPFYQLHEKVQVVEPSFKRAGGTFNKIFFYPKLLRYLRNEFKVHQPDRILSFGDFFNPLVLLAAQGLKIPVYISDRTSADFKFPFYIKYLKQKLYPHASGFIAQTQRAYDAKRNQFGEKFNQTIIPNAIRPVNKIDVPKENIILYAGRFSWEKNPGALIDAYADIKDKKEWRLVMLGDGPLWNEMKTKASKLGLENQIDFLGAVSDIDLWLNKASIFVLPSVLEGFPNALCEAMTAGLPVICFDSIAYESIITKNVDGIVIPFEEITSLSAAISDLMQLEQKRKTLGNQAALKSNQWKAEIVLQQYSQFLKLHE
jgi:GalNAc-alpha-(1->4)-GalNAc-alpha-(1->3)-diNAcBac-PP-undecaprenol alpha-1,4-N-acetyl-D-galactosaminyltransferase